MHRNRDLPKLLRAIANSENARACKHDVIFNAAADELEYYHSLIDIADQLIALRRKTEEKELIAPGVRIN